MRKVLEKARFKLLVLVGDVYQIESIYFGNWFDIARNFISKGSIFELTYPYRTQNRNLLTVWERVRNLDIAILEPNIPSVWMNQFSPMQRRMKLFSAWVTTDCTELTTSIASYRTVIRVRQFSGASACIKLAIPYCLMNQTASLHWFTTIRRGVL